MQLFERVELILSLKKMARYALAEKLGIKQNTFTRYFCPEHQGKIAPHLWEILNIFPDVNRDWLFFEEGEPFSETKADEGDLATKIAQLQGELDAERVLNRQLMTRILIDGVGDKGAVTSIGKAADGHE